MTSIKFSELINSNKVLPEITTTGTGGNSANYVSKAVGGKSRKTNKKSRKSRKTNNKSRKSRK